MSLTGVLDHRTLTPQCSCGEGKENAKYMKGMVSCKECENSAKEHHSFRVRVKGCY